MANTHKENLEQALHCLKEGNYSLKKRYLLQAEDSEGNRHHSLNEFLFSKKDPTSMITVKAEYDDMFINRYWADGLLIASPTGSTAYNLSSGGPIVLPECDVMVLTPINPHSLTTRPLVLPSNKPLKITVKKQNHHVSFSYDGTIFDFQRYPLEVIVQRSDFSVELVELPDQNYFNTLRQKLMWGANSRQRT
jgi:NAD+ kinase